MKWLVLAKEALIWRNSVRGKPTIAALSYHSRHGVYGCKPQKEKPVFRVPPNVLENRIKEGQLYQLVTAYRQHGHRKAQLDPLGLQQPSEVPELDPGMYGLSPSSTQNHSLEGILDCRQSSASTEEVIRELQKLYCGPLSAEFQHLSNLEEREWFAKHFEEIHQQSLPDDRRVHLAKLMLQAQAFDHFLANKFTTVKRYGGEGAESAFAFYDELFRMAAYDSAISDVLLCIAHRGRLNLLTCLMKFPPVIMFRKMKGQREFPENVKNSGDVLSHLTSSVDVDYDGHTVHLTMLPNPSHLEAINPVAAGKTRARQQSLKKGDYAPEGVDSQPGDGALCFMVHGDGAFSGQGVVAETFSMSATPHFSVGGSVHLIINNQVGFTTCADRGRSSHYCSDIGKMVECPVIHVNGDYPEEVVKSCQLAMAYRNKFHKDILIDYVCYRRWGHNELDEPAFTQPQMYDIIRNRQSIPDMYADQLVNTGVCSREELSDVIAKLNKNLLESLSEVDTYVPKAEHLKKQWSGMVQAPAAITVWDTGVPLDVLKYVGAKSVSVPPNVPVHQTLTKTHIARRITMMEEGVNIDWAAAEAMAFGSLLYQGYNIRINGQDVGRGTFSHRHCMIVNQETEATYIPLNHIVDYDKQGHLEACNSVLSEEASLGFEYGISIESPKILAIWEAQFGDFFNGAQIMIDTFITGGEAKWLQQSGLVMLLPHGIDGAGPEHSSAKIERFLQQTDSSETAVDGDDVNIHIVNPTTPAQYFHLLRRQIVRNFRKPLIVIAPKGMLRHPSCVSSLSDMSPGTTFLPVIGDSEVDPAAVSKVVFLSGKHYYVLQKERESRGVKDLALIRLECLCPFPVAAIQEQLNKFPNAKDFIWAQEEHRNSGAWSFMAPRFFNLLGKKLHYAGRPVSPIPATGIGEVHQKEAKQIVEDVFKN